MKKFWTILVIGFLIMILPFAGFSPSFDARVQFIFGLIIVILAFLSAKEYAAVIESRRFSSRPLNKELEKESEETSPENEEEKVV